MGQFAEREFRKLTPEREQELRDRIAAMLCGGCSRRDPVDKHGKHVHSYQQEAFGSTWDSKSYLPCEATSPRIERLLTFVTQVIEEEKIRCNPSKI